MDATTAELLLALRSPRSGWLAALICTLDEATRDEDFADYQRELLRGLLAADEIPGVVARAAAARMTAFERSLRETQATDAEQTATADLAAVRPNLTDCGNAAA